jgi:hypothetical protein
MGLTDGELAAISALFPNAGAIAPLTKRSHTWRQVAATDHPVIRVDRRATGGSFLPFLNLESPLTMTTQLEISTNVLRNLAEVLTG